MNGRALALASVAGLAVAGLAARRGSASYDDVDSQQVASSPITPADVDDLRRALRKAGRAWGFRFDGWLYHGTSAESWGERRPGIQVLHLTAQREGAVDYGGTVVRISAQRLIGQRLGPDNNLLVEEGVTDWLESAERVGQIALIGDIEALKPVFETVTLGSRNAKERVMARPTLIPYADFKALIADGDGETPVLWDKNKGSDDALTLREVREIYSDLLYDDPEADSYARQFYRELRTAEQVFSDVSFPLTVYRGLVVPQGTGVDDRHGHWSLRRDIAEHFARGTHEASEPGRDGVRGRPVLLEGTIRRPNDVRWEQTFGAWLRYSQTPDPAEAEEQVYAWKGSVRDVRPVAIQGAIQSARRGGRELSIAIQGTRRTRM